MKIVDYITKNRTILIVIIVFVLAFTGSHFFRLATQGQQNVLISGITTEQLRDATNTVRREHKLSEFAKSIELEASSSLKCQDMFINNYFDHNNPKTGMHGYEYSRIVDPKFDNLFVSENLALGYFTEAKQVIDGLMSSKDHRDSILDPKFKTIGYAICTIPNSPNEIAIVQHKSE